MASTFTTGFGIEKIGSGEQSGAWGTTTNHNLDILDRIASYKAVALSGSTHTLTVREASPGSGTENLQDGMYRVIKFTGALGANNTVTIAPNTAPAYFIFENATTDSGSSGPYSVILTQGSGANITIQNGKNAIVYCDGAGSGAAVVNALSDLQIATLEVTGAAAIDGALTLGGAITGATNITLSGELDAATLDISGNADIDGTTNLDAVDIDGAVQIDATLSVGVDDQGYDVKFFGDTASAYMLWDTSADDLILGGGARLGVGTTSPSYLIHQVQAGADTAAEIQTTGGAYGAELRLNSGGASPAAYVTGRGSGTENWRVGSNSQGNTLELKTGANAVSHFTFDASGAVYNDDSADLDFRVESDGNANMLFVDGGNNRVGIGTASPVANLGLVGGTSNATNLSTAYSTAAFNITPKSTSGYSLAFGSGPSDFPYIQMSAGGSSAHAMTINPYGGNVGIGNVSPGNLLQIGPINATETLNVVAASGGASMIMRSTGGTLGTLGSTNNVPVAFWQTTAKKMRLLADGKFVIGAATATDNLQVTGSGRQAVGISSTSSGAAVLEMVSSGSTEAISYGTDLRFASISGLGDSGFSEKMRINSNGTIGIAVAAIGDVQLAMQINGQSWFAVFESDDGTDQFRIASTGNVTNTNNSYGAISDIKLKENITAATPKLADLMQVKICNFNFIGDTTKQIGVIAQELETVFPGMVDDSPDPGSENNDLGTTTKSVKYSVFVPILIKAMQEQQATIEALTARITALEG